MATAAELLAIGGSKLRLPVDLVHWRNAFDAAAEKKVVPTGRCAGWLADAGYWPQDGEGIREGDLNGAGTVVWNGPMGVFEFPAFAEGTYGVAKAVAASGAISVIGGGESVAAIQQSGLADKITHISTGGGASLEMLEGLVLPGLAALQDK